MSIDFRTITIETLLKPAFERVIIITKQLRTNENQLQITVLSRSHHQGGICAIRITLINSVDS